jgi:hypothetical protein
MLSMREHAIVHRRDRDSPPTRKVDPWAAPEAAGIVLETGLAGPGHLGGSVPARILSLQRAVGNAAVSEWLARAPGRDAAPDGHAHRDGPSAPRAGWLGDDEEDEQGAGEPAAGTSDGGVEQWLGDAASDAADAVASGVDAIADTASDIATDVASGAGAVADTVWDIGSDVASDIESAIESTVGDVGDLATDALGSASGGDTGAEETTTGAGGGTSSTTFGPPTNSTYSVSGSLLEAANTIAARPEAGLTTSTPALDTDTANDKVTAARVTIAEAVELPEWTDKAKGNAQQQAEWDRFAVAIGAHEAGHVQRDRASWAKAHTRLVGKSAADANSAFDKISAAADATNAQYDTTTANGKNEGTTINPHLGTVTKVP